MSIYRYRSGLIFDDDFNFLDTLRWGVSPSNSYAIGDSTLDLKHSEEETSMLFDIPMEEEQLLFQVHADYVPTELGDEGGIVVWKSAEEKIEFMESFDVTKTYEHSKWRAVKRNNLWTFYAYREGAWELFDSSICLNPIKAGVVLKNPQEDGFIDLKVDQAILCRGTHVEVGNVSSGYEVSLLDEAGTEVRRVVVPDGYSGVFIELPEIPFTGRLEVIDPLATTEAGQILHTMESDAVMYGGDLFLIGTHLKVYWKGMELDTLKPTYLGAMKNGEILEKMTLVNPSSGNVAEDIEMRVAVYNDEWGWEWVDIALDVAGTPDTYHDYLYFGTLMPEDTRDFWVKVTRVADKFASKPTHFMLDIRNN